MSVPQPRAAENGGPSDAELITAVRGGDTEAYGQLYRRHVASARQLARQLTRSATDLDDLVAEAFAKVLDTLRGGGGPDTAFRAYLLTTLRNTLYDRVRRDRRLELSDDMSRHDPGVPWVDTAVAGLESSLAARAFARLPERWQTVLWHTEVEQETPAQVAPLLGLTPNGVAALAYRAREGLRQAYLQEHLADVGADGCRYTVERLGAWARGALSARERSRVDEHLAGCDRCRLLAAELAEVNGGLRGILAPLLLGAPLAAAYLASVGPEAAAGAAAGAAAAGAGVVGTGAGAAGAGAGAAGAARRARVRRARARVRVRRARVRRAPVRRAGPRVRRAPVRRGGAGGGAAAGAGAAGAGAGAAGAGAAGASAAVAGAEAAGAGAAAAGAAGGGSAAATGGSALGTLAGWVVGTHAGQAAAAAVAAIVVGGAAIGVGLDSGRSDDTRAATPSTSSASSASAASSAAAAATPTGGLPAPSEAAASGAPGTGAAGSPGAPGSPGAAGSSASPGAPGAPVGTSGGGSGSAGPVLDVTGAVVTKSLRQGESGEITIVVGNTGRSAANQLTATVSMPPGLTVGSSGDDDTDDVLGAGSWACAGAGAVATCTSPALPPGSSSELRVPVQVAPAAAAGPVTGSVRANGGAVTVTIPTALVPVLPS